MSVRGVALNDVYRDANGELWEVLGLITEPQAFFRRARDGATVTHVIGCLNMENQFPYPPLRSVDGH